MTQRVGSNKLLDLHDLVRVTECQLALGEDAFRLRIELTRSRQAPRRFRANVWRTDFYRIQPTFPQTKRGLLHKPCDEQVWVEWSILRYYHAPFAAPSVAAAEKLVLTEVESWIRHARAECGVSAPHPWGDCAGRS